MGAIPFDFACNDPDNGSFAGRVFIACRPGSVQQELEAWPDSFAFTDGGNFIRIHRHKFKVELVQECVGNWCWNRYWFKPGEYRRLIRTLARNGWHCTGGTARWVDAYDALRSSPPRTP